MRRDAAIIMIVTTAGLLATAATATLGQQEMTCYERSGGTYCEPADVPKPDPACDALDEEAALYGFAATGAGMLILEYHNPWSAWASAVEDDEYAELAGHYAKYHARSMGVISGMYDAGCYDDPELRQELGEATTSLELLMDAVVDAAGPLEEAYVYVEDDFRCGHDARVWGNVTNAGPSGHYAYVTAELEDENYDVLARQGQWAWVPPGESVLVSEYVDTRGNDDWEYCLMHVADVWVE